MTMRNTSLTILRHRQAPCRETSRTRGHAPNGTWACRWLVLPYLQFGGFQIREQERKLKYMYVSKLVSASFKLMISAFSHHDRVGCQLVWRKWQRRISPIWNLYICFVAPCNVLDICGLVVPFFINQVKHICYLSAYIKANAIGLCRHWVQNYIISSEITNKSITIYYHKHIFLTFQMDET